MCPGTSWTLAATEDVPSATARLKNERVPIVLCERDSQAGNWKDVLGGIGRQSPAPPMLIVASPHG